MLIRRLRLSGFKSFVEPAELHIEPGLTGIVGPNGCGKSNLLEAMRWAMGEGSAKSLRGGGMEDVIFAGTAQRPAREFAEVTILARKEASDRPGEPGAPGNDDDEEIEVVRRIERGLGSAYRLNGRDVRAKDVALLFADAATGAHSPALVSQGRIGAVIAAKPAERRMMLEEAAGISGLHARRKDAEQKLRATEANLERLATILGDMDARAGALRRQARAAERYRQLSDAIMIAEGRLIFVRWTHARDAAEAAKAEAQAAEAAVAKAQAEHTELTTAQAEAAHVLADARATHSLARETAGEIAQRLITATAERDSLTSRIADLTRQSQQLADDRGREDKTTRAAADALAALQAQAADNAEELKDSEMLRPALEREAETAERAMRDADMALATARGDLARAEAALGIADNALATARGRAQRLEADQARLQAELAALGDVAELEATLSSARGDAESATAARDTAITERSEAEAARATATAARDEALAARAAATAALRTLESERDSLARDLAREAKGGARALDAIKAAPGVEAALAAALGEEIEAPVGGLKGWLGGATPAPASPPEGTTALLDHVAAPGELAARLARIWLADEDNGQPLGPGERLVTRAGRVRRWDGFVAEGTGEAAAARLRRANRLAAVEADIPGATQAVETANAAHATALAAAENAERRRRSADEAARSGEERLRSALRDADRAELALERRRASQAGLAERIDALTTDLTAAREELAAAEAARAALPDAAGERARADVHAREAEGRRARHMAAQADLSSLAQRIAQQRERRATSAAEIRGWQARAGEAEQRAAEMARRADALATELDALAERPAAMEAKVAALAAERQTAVAGLSGQAEAERTAEAILRGIETRLAAAAEALSSAREARAGAQARAENQELRRVEMGRIAGERFECPPPLLPEKLGFDATALLDPQAESATLERLSADRERLGPVNLVAADELASLTGEMETAAAESEELAQAVHRLRGSIGSLNREGRQRLLTAFEAVDGHFRRLFTTLFDGGQAHLALVESDDPLEAGLEIMAQPPGKKLSSLTLLSGGEQALTAVALIFALFLTNPAPICVLDEVDAPLDDANVERFCDLLDRMQRETQTRYLIVTHNAVTMSRMHRLFGVTMIERGVSRLVSVDLGGASELLAAE